MNKEESVLSGIDRGMENFLLKTVTPNKFKKRKSINVEIINVEFYSRKK